MLKNVRHNSDAMFLFFIYFFISNKKYIEDQGKINT